MPSEAQKKANKKYKQKIKQIPIDFYPTDADILEHLDKQPRKATYIKDLIRKDMKENDA